MESKKGIAPEKKKHVTKRYDLRKKKSKGKRKM